MQEIMTFYEASGIVSLYATTHLLYVDNSSITIFVEGLFQYYFRAQFAASKLIFSLWISYQILISPMSAAFYTCLS